MFISLQKLKLIAPIVFMALFGVITINVGSVQAQTTIGTIPRVIATNPANAKTCVKLNTSWRRYLMKGSIHQR